MSAAPGPPSGGGRGPQAPGTDIPDTPRVTDAAIDAAQRGMCIFPLKRGTKDGHMVSPWPKWSTSDAETIAAEFAGRDLNYGIDCGKSGLLVVDEDKLGALQEYAQRFGHTIPATFTVVTGKGRHFYFRQNGTKLGNTPGAFADLGIDVRGHGGYVLGAGSVHPSGAVYTAENQLDPAPVPDWVSDALTGAGELVRLRRCTDSSCPSGYRWASAIRSFSNTRARCRRVACRRSRRSPIWNTSRFRGSSNPTGIVTRCRKRGAR